MPGWLKDLLDSSTNLIARQLAVAREEGADMSNSTPGYSGLEVMGDFKVAEIIFHVELDWFGNLVTSDLSSDLNMFLVCIQCWLWSGLLEDKSMMWSFPPSNVTAYTSMAKAATKTHPRQEHTEVLFDTTGEDEGAVEVDAGLVTDWESCLTEPFPFLMILAVLPIVVLLMVEEEMLLVMLFSPTN